ncbi:MAG: MOSC domain-containing protein [Ilumatobacteraceae bacterium]
MRISSIWSYPVKSMVGEQVDRAELSPLGIVGDRRFATRDHARGGIRGAKQIGELMRFSARSDGDGQAIITFPDGTEVATTHADVDRLLSACLGRKVSLEALRPASDLDHYRRGAPDSDDLLTELRAVFGRQPDEPLPDFARFPPVIAEYESPPGTYHDAYPLMILSTSALRALADALPDSVIDVRRFRPSFVVDTGDEVGHPELAWEGRRATIGSAEVEFVGRCPRCVMVTREIADDVPADRAVLRHIVRALDQDVGQYANVVTPGPIAVGDELVLT